MYWNKRDLKTLYNLRMFTEKKKNKTTQTTLFHSKKPPQYTWFANEIEVTK